MTEKISVMYSEAEVEKRIQQLAAQLNEVYGNKPLRLLCILKGSVFFCCELAKHLTMPVTMDFMSVSSYGEATVSSGEVTIKKDLDESIQGMDCLLIEDIIDTGYTLSRLKPLLQERKPSSLRICTLLDKPSRREADITVDYTGFEIPDEFVVGFGLDYAQRYRNLPYIGRLEFVKDSHNK
jgi:hypoxanthine phosphoribosyltransferase